MFWENLREEEFKEAVEKCGKLCVIPIGCTEKHGQHLPLGTDVFIAESVCEMAAEMEEVMILRSGPWLGEVCCFHADKDPEGVRRMGNIAIKPSTLLAILEELCDECGRNGFTKVLFVNAHGGNTSLLNLLLREQTYEDKPYVTMVAHTNVSQDKLEPEPLLAEITKRREEFSFVTEEDIAVLRGWMPEGYMGGHADITEAALVMADHPELVARDRYEAESGAHVVRVDDIAREGVKTTNMWYGGMPNCYSGRPPHGTSVGIGMAMKKLCAERMARIFKKIKENDELLNVSNMDRS